MEDAAVGLVAAFVAPTSAGVGALVVLLGVGADADGKEKRGGAFVGSEACVVGAAGMAKVGTFGSSGAGTATEGTGAVVIGFLANENEGVGASTLKAAVMTGADAAVVTAEAGVVPFAAAAASVFFLRSSRSVFNASASASFFWYGLRTGLPMVLMAYWIPFRFGDAI